ncbi:hypothetical protein O1V64_00190 (plasmid) [Rouxiella badensis]|uniref:Uncharacterized protein n=1 Tax=Rouxiella badensis TaxID=1646377 RepID=A0A1X0WB13_9GAMM|nr:hypothetical protein [Rouxiella badensis]ORJ23954.1 hypothetical protein BS640_18815 [Rouxiella badensis]WAT03203.1 hypothetical protein O1V64_00530 [Rouxiella badensis]WAT03276.1 hypothetical protein O1V64_00190 [Rouxiella badensis]
MTARKTAAAEKAAVSAAEASEAKTPATIGEAAESAAVIDSVPNLSESEDDGPVPVVVLPRNTLRHNGKTYRPHAKVRVPAAEVPRLVKRGIVVTAEQALADALAQEGVSVSVQDGVSIGRG